MAPKTYFLVTCIVFSIIAALHLTRYIFAVEISIHGMHIPNLLSVIGFVGALLLARFGFILYKKS